MYVFAASFLAYPALLFYVDFWGPQGAGISAQFSGGSMVLRTVVPNSPAGRARLQPGDRAVAANGQAVHNLPDWAAVHINLEVDRPFTLDIEPGGQRGRQKSFGTAPSGWSTEGNWRPLRPERPTSFRVRMPQC